MKKIVVFLVFLSMLMFACNITSTPTPVPPVTQEPVTVQPATQPATQPPAVETPTDTVQPAPATNVTCNELKLYLDPSLASGYECKTTQAVTEGPGLAPAYTELTLQGYPISGAFFQAHIDVIPVAAYQALSADFVNQNVTALQGLTSGGPIDKSLPLMPLFNAAQEFHAQYSVLPFQSGTGIRFLTEYAQFTDPINNHDMFYTYQGLTADGKYWVSAVLPINNGLLPANGDNPPDGTDWNTFSNNWDKYLADITGQLNGQPGSSFTPTIQALDTLVSSIVVQP